MQGDGFRSIRRVAAAAALFLAAGLVSAGSPPPEKVALTNAKIIPIVGEGLDSGTILIERGRIVAIGKDVEVPFDARVFDLKGKTVMPGLVHPNCYRGTDGANEARPITPQLDTADSIDPSQIFFEDQLRIGIAAINVMPGDNTVIGGLGRIVRPIGLTPAQMTIAEGAFLKVCISPRAGYDRMLQMASLRETFTELDSYLEKLAEKRYEDKLRDEQKKMDVGLAEQRKRGRALIRAEDVDDEHRNILRARGGIVRFGGEDGPTLFKPLGAMVTVRSAMDVAPAVKLAKEFGFFDRTVFVLGPETFKAISELKSAARPVILPEEMIHRETDPLTGDQTEVFVPKRFFDAGLLFAITPGSDQSMPERMPTYQAARCVRGGIPRDVALRAITLNAAKVLGLDDRIGSIEVGKEAYLTVFSGDPLDFNSVVEKVFIEGIPAYEREKDVRIQRLLSTESQPAAAGGGE